MIQQLVTGLISVFLGAIPFGFLLGRMRGVDLRTQGSGNTGATNTARVLGKGLGLLTLLLDVGKGAFAAYLGSRLDPPGSQVWACASGFLALLGHCFSPFLRFRGGKGVATGLGIFFVLSPFAAFMALGVFGAAIRACRYVSLSSILAAASVPAVIYLDPKGAEQVTLLTAIAAASLVVLRHHANISRLVAGTEPKWKEKPESGNGLN